MKSGRTPFKLSNPQQRISELSDPFTRKAQQGVESICLPALVAGGDTLLPQTGAPFITGSPDSPNQVWIADWIASQGETMDYQNDIYTAVNHNGATWKAKPLAACRTGVYADDAQSVNYSSSGQEFFDFQSSSSSDTGHSSFQYVDQGNTATLRQHVDDTSVSGSTLPRRNFDNDTGSHGFYQAPRMVQDSTANDMAHYEHSPFEIQSGYAMEYMDNSSPSDDSSENLPQLDDFVDMQGQYQGQEQLDMFNAIQVHGPYNDMAFLEHGNGSATTVNDGAWTATLSTHATVQSHISGPTVASSGAQTVTPTGDVSGQIRPNSVSRSIPLLPRPPVSTRQDAVRKNDETRKADGTKSKKVLSNCQPRSHEYYLAKPGKDGFYHCPWKKRENCAHEPTKQKCTYE